MRGDDELFRVVRLVGVLRAPLIVRRRTLPPHLESLSLIVGWQTRFRAQYGHPLVIIDQPAEDLPPRPGSVRSRLCPEPDSGDSKSSASSVLEQSALQICTMT